QFGGHPSGLLLRGPLERKGRARKTGCWIPAAKLSILSTLTHYFRREECFASETGPIYRFYNASPIYPFYNASMTQQTIAHNENWIKKIGFLIKLFSHSKRLSARVLTQPA